MHWEMRMKQGASFSVFQAWLHDLNDSLKQVLDVITSFSEINKLVRKTNKTPCNHVGAHIGDQHSYNFGHFRLSPQVFVIQLPQVFFVRQKTCHRVSQYLLLAGKWQVTSVWGSFPLQLSDHLLFCLVRFICSNLWNLSWNGWNSSLLPHASASPLPPFCSAGKYKLCTTWMHLLFMALYEARQPNGESAFNTLGY